MILRPTFPSLSVSDILTFLKKYVQFVTLIAYIATIFVFLDTISTATKLSNEQSTYIDRDGMWPAFQEEREFLLLKNVVYRIYMSDKKVGLSDYQYRFGAAIGRLGYSTKFFEELQGIPKEHLETQRQIVFLSKQLEEIDKPNSLPNVEDASRMLLILDDLIDLCHRMVNFRRDETYKDNRDLFSLVTDVRKKEIIILGILVASGVITFALERSTTKQLKSAQLLLHQMMTRIGELAAIAERSRMAMDLHDGMGQPLYGADVLSQALLVEYPHNKNCIRLYNAIKSIQLQFRNVLNALREDVSRSLEDALNEPMDLVKLSGIRVNFVVFGEKYDVSAVVRYTLRLIVQEALTNIQKHADASEVSIRLDYSNPKSLKLEIVDNGRGFQGKVGKHKPGHGNGLQTMRNNAISLGGKFDFKTSTKGVHIWITVPIS